MSRSSMSLSKTRDGRPAVSALAVLIAAAYLTAGLVRHDLAVAVGAPIVVVGYVVALWLFGRRSEPAALLAGNARDERQAGLQRGALEATGGVLILVLVGGAFWTMLIGSAYAVVFGGLCVVGGVTFVAATFVLSRRG